MGGFFARLFRGGGSGAPSSVEVGRRLYALKLVTMYGLVRQTPPGEGVRTLSSDLCSAARANGIWGVLAKGERRFLQDTAWPTDQQQVVDSSWRLESLGTLLWATQLIPWMPGWDTQFDGEALDKLPADGVAEFIRSLSLRPIEKLEAMRSTAELWHWRSRTRQCIEEGQPFPAIPTPPDQPPLRSFEDVVRMTARLAHEQGAVEEVVDEDFGVRGKAFRDLTPDEWSEIRSITFERHYALNWVCGRAPGNRWEETPTDT